jgi:3-methylfumaryl-CoA hydratase
VSEPAPRLDEWLNKQAMAEDDITAYPITALAATLERQVDGRSVPPLWHWLYFLPTASMAQIGPDGHPKRGGFLPPVDLPRRMWAGGRLVFHGPLVAGDRATRTSTITAISEKQGGTGPLVFITVRHLIEVRGELKIEEEHDIVYRGAPGRGDPRGLHMLAPLGAQWQRVLTADPVLLFRYSALTFNGHRIHYDYPYVTNVEGYPGLIVHGPLIATLLVDLIARERPDATLRGFSFKALRPTFGGDPFTLCGTPHGGGAELWAHDHEGFVTMTATADFA